jgi:DNA polymerase, archaea type
MLMQILDMDYFFATNKPVIRIFGRTDKGQSVCALYDQLLPYFYIKCTDDQGEKISQFKEVKQVEDVEMFLPIGYSSKKTQLKKITLINPQEVPEMRDKITALGVKEIFEADILFKYRFMVDNKIYGMQWVEVEGARTNTKVSKVPTYHATDIVPIERTENIPLKILSFDIECISNDVKRVPDSKKDPIVMISAAFGTEFKGKKDMVYVAKNFTGENVKGVPTEKEMLEEFVKMIDEYDPDVVTGYNINNFDLPYLTERLKQNKIPLSIGRSDKPMFGRTTGINFEFTIPGRIVFDPYQILKKDPWLKFHKYDLNTVAKKMLGEQKHDVEYGEMLSLWTGSRENLGRFVEYARKDAVLVLRLVVEKGLMDKFFELSKLSGLLLQDVFGGQTRRVDTMLLHEFKKRGYVMALNPNKSDLIRRTKERDKEGLKGATVLEPKKGLHADGCVLVMDFKSLYPSIMRTFNVSPDTLLLDDSDLQVHVSPVGAKFVTADVSPGILPTLLTNLVEMRSRIKKEMKTATGEEKRILNAKQLAIKDMSNSFYGYTGYIRARLYTIDVAASITAYGRTNIEKTQQLVEKNFDVEVVYGDTDSIFLKTKTIDLDEAKKLGEAVAKFVSDNLPGHLELQFEKIYRTFLILTKKRYAGLKYEMIGDKWVSEIEMRGIETVRRDWCPLVSELMMDVLNSLLKEGDLQKSITVVKGVIEKLRNNEVDLEKLTVVKGITKHVDSYEGMLPHIELARKLTIRNPQEAPRIGDRLGFVIIKGNQILSKRAEDPNYVRKHKIEIDSDYYIQSQLLPPIERIFSSVGIERSEILGNGRQISLGDLMNGTKRQMKHDIEVRYKKEDPKKEDKTEALKGWEEFVCKKCKKSYARIPLQGSCPCGGELLMSYHGSVSNRAVVG